MLGEMRYSSTYRVIFRCSMITLLRCLLLAGFDSYHPLLPTPFPFLPANTPCSHGRAEGQEQTKRHHSDGIARLHHRAAVRQDSVRVRRQWRSSIVGYVGRNNCASNGGDTRRRHHHSNGTHTHADSASGRSFANLVWRRSLDAASKMNFSAVGVMHAL